jgi:hypothetical protein
VVVKGHDSGHISAFQFLWLVLVWVHAAFADAHSHRRGKVAQLASR